MLRKFAATLLATSMLTAAALAAPPATGTMPNAPGATTLAAQAKTATAAGNPTKPAKLIKRTHRHAHKHARKHVRKHARGYFRYEHRAKAALHASSGKMHKAQFSRTSSQPHS